MPTNHTQQIVNKAWSFAHVLRDDGLSYMAYTEQITFLLFLKMSHELTQPPWGRDPLVPKGLDWPSLLVRDGEELEAHYRRILRDLPKNGGMLGEIFKKARQEIQNPSTLKRLIVDLIDPEDWMSMDADVKGDIYEGLLAKSAQESPKGAGQYFTPRVLIKAIVDVMQPGPEDTVCDPACGTGGFLLAAHDHVVRKHGSTLDPDQKRHLRERFVQGGELVPATARLCIMNLYLHGISPDRSPIHSGVDSLANDPGDRFSMVLTNPPFGKKSSFRIVNEEGEMETESHVYERQDFWTSTKNKQLNFLQHVKTLLRVHGSCAIVVPDNVLFEDGAGETVRRNLLQQFDVHTLLRLPTGIFYKPGVKANVLFFDAKPAREQPWTERLWVYDLRTNKHFTLKLKPLRREDLNDFVACYRPDERHNRQPTWSPDNESGRWRAFEYDELTNRDKLNLDLLWIKDSALKESENLPEPEALAGAIVEDLHAALEAFRIIAEELESTRGGMA
ncbi:MAG: class I SAM-dependent DNA methyltransferase [Gemmatimonadetes bacterium]|nr:class I SAM-dependent DNA methyltransferase [Gemmatimonadota bacterium]